MEMYLRQARIHALDGRFDEAVHALIATVEELADQLKPNADASKEPEGPTAISEETKSALLALRKAFFDLLATAKGREWNDQDLRLEYEKNGVAVFSDEQAVNGQFEELEDELKKSGIPFNRYSSGYCEYNPEKRYFRPATPDSQEIDVTFFLHEDYDEFVPAAAIRQYLDLPAEEFKAKVLELLQKWDPDVQPLSEWVATTHLKVKTIG